MNTIIDYAKTGAEQIGELRSAPKLEMTRLEAVVSGLQRSKKRVRIEVEASDGTLKPAEVVPIPVSGSRSIQLLSFLSLAQASGYLRHNGVTAHGMLSPNYDSEGVTRKDTIRFQAVAGGFTIQNNVWLPEPNNAIYLAGATGIESRGMGGHDVPASEDPEHQLTIYGALSVGDISIARRHAQHEVREKGGSVASSLSGGRLGNVFAPGSIKDFNGFSQPIELTGNEDPSATFYMPVGYLDNPEEAFGAYITSDSFTPEQILTGAALRAVSSRGSDVELFTKAMEA